MFETHAATWGVFVARFEGHSISAAWSDEAAGRGVNETGVRYLYLTTSSLLLQGCPSIQEVQPIYEQMLPF